MEGYKAVGSFLRSFLLSAHLSFVSRSVIFKLLIVVGSLSIWFSLVLIRLLLRSLYFYDYTKLIKSRLNQNSHSIPLCCNLFVVKVWRCLHVLKLFWRP